MQVLTSLHEILQRKTVQNFNQCLSVERCQSALRKASTNLVERRHFVIGPKA